MKSRDFAFWLQGYLELSQAGEPLTSTQVQIIKNHLAMVFEHEIDPSMGNQEELNKIHDSFKFKLDPSATGGSFIIPARDGSLIRC